MRDTIRRIVRWTAFSPAAVVVCSAAASSAFGADWSGQVGLASEYISKGAGKSDGQAQVWGRAEVARGGAYAGTWVSTLEVPQAADAEVQVYAGRREKFGATGVDVAAFYKTFPGTRSGVDRDMVELRADVSRKLGPVQGRLRAEWTPDNFGVAKQALWLEGRLAWALSAVDEVSIAIGERRQEHGSDYLAWNVGVRRALTETLSADLRWFDTDNHRAGDAYQGRIVVGLTASF